LSYFADHYSDFAIPIETDDSVGWRLAQAGALHALAGHFYSTNQRALVAMPTGSGKSAVFMGLPFLLQAERVLIVTTSRIVRDQLASDFQELSTLKALGTFSQEIPFPRVRAVSSRSAAIELEGQKDLYDVVVAVPAAFQTIDLGATMTTDLFDLMIVDEAHHLAAPTWTALTSHFTGARQALFTATPVRRDRKRLSAKYVCLLTCRCTA